MTVSELDFSIPFRIYDATNERYLFSVSDKDAPGDIPPDIANMTVISKVVDMYHGVTEIEVIR